MKFQMIHENYNVFDLEKTMDFYVIDSQSAGL